MKKFKSIKSYEKMLNEFCNEEDNVNVIEDLKEFVKNDKFVIYDMVSDGLSDDDVIFVREKYYLICQRYEGCKFIEIEKDEFEDMCEF